MWPFLRVVLHGSPGETHEAMHTLYFLWLTLVESQAMAVGLSGRIVADLPPDITAAVTCTQSDYRSTAITREAFEFAGLAPGTCRLTVVCVGYRQLDTTLKLPLTQALELVLEKNLRTYGEAMIVEATRAGNDAPYAITELESADIAQYNNGTDIPFVLRYTPSASVTSDAGNGIGYTGLWLRGTDGTRIQVSLNGVPLNDPESQQTFFVNMPDLSSSADRIQIQRGIGSTALGAGSFGGAVRVETTSGPTEAYAASTHGAGSFGTFRNTLQLGSGLLNDRWVTECRVSDIRSEGYVDRASARLQSAMLTQTLYLANTTLRGLYTIGQERTYQAWYGTPVSRLADDTAGMVTHAFNNGFSQEQLENLLSSGRTYNFYEYENEVDQYRQQHAQLMLTHRWTDNLSSSATIHYTHGQGYFEQWRGMQELSAMGLPAVPIASGQVWSDSVDENGLPVSGAFASLFGPDASLSFVPLTDAQGQVITDSLGQALLQARADYTATDLVRRRWLNNHFLFFTGSVKYTGRYLTLTAGVSGSRYRGEHFGELVHMAQWGALEPGHRYYQGHGWKLDDSGFLRMHWVQSRWQWSGEIQLRRVNYRTQGTDNDLQTYGVRDDMVFVNPRLGVRHILGSTSAVYGSLAWAGHEPNRNDYIDAPEGSFPKPEYMLNLEMGYEYETEASQFTANLYAMYYRDQLVPDGSLNDVGAVLRMNVPESYRLGIELSGRQRIATHWSAFGNLTLSDNRITDFRQILYDYTDGFALLTIPHRNTHISFSPAVLASGGIQIHLPTRGTAHAWRAWVQARYTGRQFLDNTSDREKSIPAYAVADTGIESIWTRPGGSRIALRMEVLNALNNLYVANGYTYSYIMGEKITERFYYPQATRHFMLQLSVSLGAAQ